MARPDREFGIAAELRRLGAHLFCVRGVPMGSSRIATTQVGILVLAFLPLFADNWYASPITSPAALSSGFTLIDFEFLPTNGEVLTPLPNPLVIGDATFSSLTGNLSLYDLSLSTWTADTAIVGSKTLFPGAEPDSAIAIDFSAHVAQFLVGWGDPNYTGNLLLAFDSYGNLLETAAVALGPPGSSHAAWIGFVRSTADISRIVIQPDQSLPFGDDYTIDNIHYNTAPVPEPATLLLLGAGLAAVFGRVGSGPARRARRSASDVHGSASETRRLN